MKARRTWLAVLPVPLVAAIAVAGCGSSNSTSTTAAASGSTTTGAGAAAGGAATIDVTKNAQLGSILTDSKGDVVYLFQKDSGGKSACSGQCASIWPPLTTSGQPQAGNGVVASKLGTTKRSDGSTQVTYAGHPLYTYTADTSPGEVKGNGINTFGAVWNAVQPSGSAAPSGGSAGGGGSSSGGSSSGGYSY